MKFAGFSDHNMWRKFPVGINQPDDLRLVTYKRPLVTSDTDNLGIANLRLLVLIFLLGQTTIDRQLDTATDHHRKGCPRGRVQ